MNIYDSLMDIFDEKKQRHLCQNNAPAQPRKVGCSKSMIFFCTFFDLDKEAFY